MDVFLISPSVSLHLSKCDDKLPSLLVKTLMIVDMLQIYSLCSRSNDPVVTNRASLRQYEKPLYTKQTTSFVTGSLVTLKLVPSAFSTVISN